jgi:hypothetical protein
MRATCPTHFIFLDNDNTTYFWRKVRVMILIMRISAAYSNFIFYVQMSSDKLDALLRESG